jgi:hypothetical protein
LRSSLEGSGVRANPTWSELARRAQAFRIAHAAFAVVSLSSLGYIWLSAATRRRDRRLTGSLAVLSFEAVALVIGRGNCPFGPTQAKLGDPVPLFELVLPPRAAKAAIPVLTVVSVVGILAAAVRGPRSSGAGAGDGSRTRDIQLGRLTLYRLSYSRLTVSSVPRRARDTASAA